MRRRIAALVAAAAIAAATAAGAGASPAMAFPPPGGGWISLGWFGSLSECVAAAEANFPVHGPVYICQQHGSFYQLWMH